MTVRTGCGNQYPERSKHWSQEPSQRKGWGLGRAPVPMARWSRPGRSTGLLASLKFAVGFAFRDTHFFGDFLQGGFLVDFFFGHDLIHALADGEPRGRWGWCSLVWLRDQERDL